MISLKLKEMYQMITLGGDAELELLDSLDPFSEGRLYYNVVTSTSPLISRMLYLLYSNGIINMTYRYLVFSPPTKEILEKHQ